MPVKLSQFLPAMVHFALIDISLFALPKTLYGQLYLGTTFHFKELLIIRTVLLNIYYCSIIFNKMVSKIVLHYIFLDFDTLRVIQVSPKQFSLFLGKPVLRLTFCTYRCYIGAIH